MKFIDRLAYRIRGRKNAFPNTKHVIRYAFTSGDVDYFMMDDLFNIPWQRGMEAIYAYEELQMRCNKEYLVAHTGLVDEILTGTRIGMGEIMRIKAINDQLRQRLDWIVVPDMAYRLASIIFFDASESPERYELKYGLEKVKLWKQNSDVQSFFLQQPVRTLMPFLDGFEGNFQSYSDLIEKVNKDHLTNLSTKFSEMPVSEISAKQ
jgi:hypothetical protein